MSTSYPASNGPQRLEPQDAAPRHAATAVADRGASGQSGSLQNGAEQMYTGQKYHDGRSPSAWTVSIGGMIASIIIMCGCMGQLFGVDGPIWGLIIAGVVIFAISGIAAMVLSRRGLSNRAR